MNLSGLLDVLRGQEAYQDLLKSLASPGNGGVVSLGLIRAARPYVITALALDTGRPTLVVTARVDRAHDFAEQLVAWFPGLRVLSYAEPNPLFYQYAPWGPRSTRARLEVLADLAGGSRPGTVIVASARALMQRTLPREELLDRCITLEAGGRIPQPDVLLHYWLDMGYEPVTVVTEPGTFSRRGGILDVFPVAGAYPVRVELWGDEVESLRSFDPATQRSLDAVSSVGITPAREALPLHGPRVAGMLAGWLEGRNSGADSGQEMLPDGELLAQGRAFPALEFYLPWMVSEPMSLLDYLPGDSLVMVDGWEDLADTVAELEAQALGLRESQVGSGEIPPDMPLPLVTWGQLEDELAQARVIELAGAQEQAGSLGGLFMVGPRFAGELRRLLDYLRNETRGRRDRVVAVSRQAERLAELWREHTGGSRIPSVEAVIDPPQPSPPVFVRGTLAEGWLLRGEDFDTHLYSDAEIFGWRRPEPRRRPQPRAIAPEDFFADLSPGDHVVHVEYGIGRFEGLEKRSLGGVEREFLALHYYGNDVLYVPIYQADRLSRYVGPDESLPELSRLGTPEWARVKERARQAVEEIARDLLELYAAREAVIGHAFSRDTAWQHELEASFPYVETEDQLRALGEVKADMQKSRPMDRLICGDVGYGKTEVALRAAFKAVMDGKQVAMLVPTTVLAQQHYETFSQRLAPFPVNLEMLSRFRTRSEQEAIVAGLVSGQVDIVIGTHRLLGDDIAFRDLGLLIIDEEQRFGVTHKEHFKRMRTEVDVLTLTATPIPRTLYMSLTGVRDISIIQTAPEERLPIVTHVGRRDDDLVRQAILRELDRGGQVFYVHNRVQTIHAEADRVRRIVQEAVVAVGHGQMRERDLEGVMARFTAGEIDVLVSTSIIEAGLDIPNANTLIVDRADRFGLAQLYQLRGRVGRSAKRAYAYFFHPPLHGLTAEARARLETVAEHSDLGAGMNIAMRDMEIRGAGEILGTRQHGQISAIGFHLYTRMLAQAVKRLRDMREGSVPAHEDGRWSDLGLAEGVTIDLPIPTYIPTDYVPDMSLRIQLYRRMAGVTDEAGIDELAAELVDRFGPLPQPVENLMVQLHVKLLAIRAHVDAVISDGGQLSIRMTTLDSMDRPELQRRLGHNVRVSRTAVWLPKEVEGWQATLIDVLERLAAEHVPSGKAVRMA